MSETTKYPDEMIMSIGVLKMKNRQYLDELESLVMPNISREEMFETFLIETAFGDKVIKGSIVSSEYSKIISSSARDIAARIDENNTAIKRVARKLPLYTMSEEDITQMIAAINAFEGS